jgi:hypothetical protein
MSASANTNATTPRLISRNHRDTIAERKLDTNVAETDVVDNDLVGTGVLDKESLLIGSAAQAARNPREHRSYLFSQECEASGPCDQKRRQYLRKHPRSVGIDIPVSRSRDRQKPQNAHNKNGRESPTVLHLLLR